jgi:hypothetical protein
LVFLGERGTAKSSDLGTGRFEEKGTLFTEQLTPQKLPRQVPIFGVLVAHSATSPLVPSCDWARGRSGTAVGRCLRRRERPSRQDNRWSPANCSPARSCRIRPAPRPESTAADGSPRAVAAAVSEARDPPGPQVGRSLVRRMGVESVMSGLRTTTKAGTLLGKAGLRRASLSRSSYFRNQ